MKHHFKRTFDRLELSAESQERICAALSAHMREPQEKPARLRTRPGYFRLVLIAAVLAFAVALTGFAFKEQIISLLGGGKILQYQNEEGEDVVSVDTGFAVDPVVIYNDQIFFTLDGAYANITDQCSETSYYQYESDSPDGSHHIVLVGGALEHVGWAEFTILPDGAFFSNATYDGTEEPEWLVNGRAAVESQYK